MGARTDPIERRLGASLPFSPDSVLYVTAGLFAVTGALATANADHEATSTLLFDGFTNVGLAAFVVAATWVYLRRSDLPRSAWWNVVVGYLAGIAFIGVLVLWGSLPDLRAGASVVGLREEFVSLGNLCGLFGFFVGVSRARSQYNRRLRRDLEVSEELVESSREALWMFSDDWSELLYANAAFETVIGQSVEALEANPTSFLEAVHPDDRGFVREQLERLSDGESLEYEVRVNPGEEFSRWMQISADESRLAQLFENLFRNAIEHAGDDATITVGELGAGDGFFVEDDGPGIPPDERDEVFEAGYSTNRAGTGFGLSIVAEIVDAHGWTIVATEAADGGARFEVTGVSDAE